MSRRASSSRARAVGATLAVAAILTCVLVISVGTATGKPAAKKHVNIAHFVAIQANPVEQAIIKNVKDTRKADGAHASTTSTRTTACRSELANCHDAIASGSTTRSR